MKTLTFWLKYILLHALYLAPATEMEGRREWLERLRKGGWL